MSILYFGDFYIKKLFQVGTDCTNSFIQIDNQRHCGTFFTDADMEAVAASVTGTLNFSPILAFSMKQFLTKP